MRLNIENKPYFSGSDGFNINYGDKRNGDGSIMTRRMQDYPADFYEG